MAVARAEPAVPIGPMGSGYLAANRRFPIYATVSVITAVASLVLGVSFVLGRDAWLPVFFGG